MKIETLEKVKKIREEIQELELSINKKSCEIDELYLSDEEESNFENSYIEYYNGTEYVYMFVDRQHVVSGVELYGPAIILNDTPLIDSDTWGKENEAPEITFGTYDDYRVVEIDPKVLTGLTISKIRKISYEDFKFVFDFWNGTMTKKFGL